MVMIRIIKDDVKDAGPHIQGTSGHPVHHGNHPELSASVGKIHW